MKWLSPVQIVQKAMAPLAAWGPANPVDRTGPYAMERQASLALSHRTSLPRDADAYEVIVKATNPTGQVNPALDVSFEDKL